jgi:hypothetical protein
MAEACAKSLFETFGEVPDPRSPLGRQHPLAALLTAAVLAILSGGRGLSAIAQWIRDHEELAPLLGFTRKKKQKKQKKQKTKLKLPCVSTFHYLFKAIDIQAFEAALTRWLVAQLPSDHAEPMVNIDGKALRGSRCGAVPGVHLVAAYSPHLETALAQLQVEVNRLDRRILHLCPQYPAYRRKNHLPSLVPVL